MRDAAEDRYPKEMKLVRTALLAASAAAAVSLGAVVFSHAPAHAAQAGGPCKEIVETSKGVSYKVLFANNGAVQQYVLVTSSNRVEQDHDVLSQLVQRYGPEGVNAPSLRITGFRQGSGGMMVPDKAVDSCGRTVAFK